MGFLVRVCLWLLVFTRWIGKKLHFALPLILILAGCTKTEFFYQGRKVASFEGDMRGTKFTMSIAPEAVTIAWAADSISHSTATRAGSAATIGAVAPVITAGVTALAFLPK